MNPFSRLLALADDAGVRATAATRIVMLVGAPVSLFLAATRLPASAQGYYFVGVNIVALAQLFETGMGTIIVQFASHEWPRLRWDRNGGLDGDPAARDAVNALLAAALRWFSRAAIALFVVAGVGGAVLYGSVLTSGAFAFSVMWCGYCALTAVYLLFVPFICVAEGCGDLVAVQRMRGWQAAGVLVGLWIGIVTEGPLLAAWLAAFAQLSVAAIWLLRRHPALLRSARTLPAHLLDAVEGLRSRYLTEQGRSARLWLALYLTPQLLVPVLLRLRGGDEAGRLGVTLAIALAPLTLATAWLHGRYPSFGSLVAEDRRGEFDALARRATGEALAVFLAGSLFLTGVALLLPFVLPALAARVMPLAVLWALFAGSASSLLLQAMAGWLRAFRDEGIAPPVVAGAAGVIAASAACALFGGGGLMAVGFALSSLGFAVPLAAVHFTRVRRERLAGR